MQNYFSSFNINNFAILNHLIIKAIFISVFVFCTSSKAQEVAPEDKTAEELRAEIAERQFSHCQRLSSMSNDFIDERQKSPDFEAFFADVRKSVESDSLVGSTVNFAMSLITGQTVIKSEQTLEAWKVRVYSDTFEFCLKETIRRSN